MKPAQTETTDEAKFWVIGQLREQKVEQAASLLSVALILLRKSATGWQPVVQIVVNAHLTDPLQFWRLRKPMFMFKKAFNIFLVLSLIASFLFQNVAPVKAHEGHDKPNQSQKDIEKHKKTDFGFDGFKELNQRLQSDFLSFDNAVNFSKAELANRKLKVENGSLVGSWSPVYDLPLVPIHVMLLTNGKVLIWDSVGDNPVTTYPTHNFTRAAIWDPVTNVTTRVDNNTTGYNLFCAGFAHLPNGTPFIAGGNLNADQDGTNTIHYFNQTNNTWSLGPNMTQGGRWYPSVTPLANGEMLITSGNVFTPEVYTTGGMLRTLSNATLAMSYYPWLQSAPNGRVFYFGPDDTLQYLNANNTGSWTNISGRDGYYRDYGSYSMYDIGKILASGGSTSTKTSVSIDITNPNVNPVVTQVSDMSFGRRQHNLTVLPDGNVLATGGNYNGAELIDKNANVFEAELWNPTTKNWSVLSRADKIRQYHSTAILLLDGRVFTGGGGICGDCAAVNYLEKNMEIFTPPYLYKQDGSGDLASRPSITNAPDSVFYNQSFSIETPNANNIQQAVMMRVSSVTHSIDFEQRRIPLRFSLNGNSLTTIAPANSNVAPPGFYMLFLIDNNGVPSIAKMMQVGYGANLGAPVLVASSGANNSVNLSWIPVFGATNYQIKCGTISGNYTNTINTGNFTNLNVTGLNPATRYYFVVSAANSTQTGENSNEITVTTNKPQGNGNGLLGSYYNGLNFNTLALTRVDSQVNFNWGMGSPSPSVNIDSFSVRWVGKVEPRTSETYTFYTTSDDGVRLWVNNQLLINNWTDHGETVNTGSINLEAGQKYDIKMEFYDNRFEAVAKLEWSSPQTARQVIPQTQLYTNQPPTASTANISGRIVSPIFRNLSNVRVVLSGGGLTEPRYAQTNPFGYYRFLDVPAGEGYVITVSSKQIPFTQSSLFLNVLGDVTDANFTSDW